MSDTPPSTKARPLAVITGASSGIGTAIARRLAQRGCRTALIARRRDRLESLAAELSKTAPSFAWPLDLADVPGIEPSMRELIAAHGPPDVLVNNAGAGVYLPFMEHDWAMHRRLMDLNYFAAVATIRAVLPGMAERRKGHVINICSISAKMGPWGHAGYTAAKAALASLTQTLAGEHDGAGVHFSYVHPGIVLTDYFEADSLTRLLPRVRKHAIPADTVAKRIAALLDKPRLELCVPAHYRVLDAVIAVSPALAHRMVTRNSRPAPEKP